MGVASPAASSRPNKHLSLDPIQWGDTALAKADGLHRSQAQAEDKDMGGEVSDKPWAAVSTIPMPRSGGVPMSCECDDSCGTAVRLWRRRSNALMISCIATIIFHRISIIFH